MSSYKTSNTQKTQSDAPLYQKRIYPQQLLSIQKKLLTIACTAEFTIKNIQNPLVRSSVVTDLYFLIQELHQLVENEYIPEIQVS
ncbi:MAG: hypothetical protein PHW07_02280 [Sulfurospirillaceae bacterium]|nr:hypothetical protein [Sulfurospirillaceae bacterium]